MNGYVARGVGIGAKAAMDPAAGGGAGGGGGGGGGVAAMTNLARYPKIKTLGAGASGEVSLVVDRTNGEQLVMKRIHLCGDETDQRRAEQEVSVLKDLDHPNVVKFRNSFVERTGDCYIVMEKCEETLESVIELYAAPIATPSSAAAAPSSSSSSEEPSNAVGKDNGGDERGGGGNSLENSAAGQSTGPTSTFGDPTPPGTLHGTGTEGPTPRYLPTGVLVEWMAELLSAVAYIHGKKIVHRDIKSSNIFLSKKNHVKLGDFGVCKVLTGVEPFAQSFVGTPHYLSPEVLEGQSYNEKSDIWSLGVVFYEMCACRLPFSGKNFLAVVKGITSESPPALPSFLDPRFQTIIIQLMLQKDPMKRPSAQWLLEKQLILPVSHPSHPLMPPQKSRAIQSAAGPPLELVRRSVSPSTLAAVAAVKLVPAKSSSEIPGAPKAVAGSRQVEAANTAAGNPPIKNGGAAKPTVTPSSRPGGNDRNVPAAVAARVAPSPSPAINANKNIPSSPPKDALARNHVLKAPAPRQVPVSNSSSDAEDDSRSGECPSSPTPKVPAPSAKMSTPGGKKSASSDPPSGVAKTPVVTAGRVDAQRVVTPGPTHAAAGGVTPMSSPAPGVTGTVGGGGGNGVCLMSPEEHHASLNRIRNAKSKVNLSELRKVMKQRNETSIVTSGSQFNESMVLEEDNTSIFLPPSVVSSNNKAMGGAAGMPPPSPHPAAPGKGASVEPSSASAAREDSVIRALQLREKESAEPPVRSPPFPPPPPPFAPPPMPPRESSAESSGSPKSMPSPAAPTRHVDPSPVSGRGEYAPEVQQLLAYLADPRRRMTLDEADAVVLAVTKYKFDTFGPV